MNDRTAFADEHALVERAKNDEQAFRELYERYFNEVYGFIAKRVGGRETAEDLTSELFIKIFTKLSSYEPRDCSFRAWLYRVAHNILIDHYRKASVRRETTVEEFPEIRDENQDVNEEIMRRHDAATVRSVLDQLPERYGQVLELKFFAEMDHAEIAGVMNVTVNNVGVMVFRALRAFARYYERYVSQEKK